MVRFVVGLALVILFGSCNEGILDIEFDKAEFEANRAQWEALNINDYTFRFNSCCQQSFTYEITVVSNIVVKAIVLSDNSEIDLSNQVVASIDELFNEIELLSLNPGDPEVNPDFYLLSIDIDYHSQFKYPVNATFNYHDPNQRGGNNSWTLDSFQQN